MAISMAYLKTLTDAVNMISGAGQNVAEATLRRLIAEGDYANPHDLVRDALKELEPLFQEVSERTASISATSYDLLRSEALGEGMGAIAYPDRAEEWTRKAMYAAAAQSNDDMDAFIRAVRARLDYEAKRAAGTTMFANGAADRAHPRFARVPTGAETCPFCIMLASRGFVYWSSETAGKLDHYHAHCDCRVVPQFGGESYEGYNPDEYYDRYQKLMESGELDAEKLAQSAARKKPKESAKAASQSEPVSLHSEAVRPERIIPVNEITDQDKYAALVYDFERGGWNGRPIVAVDMGDGNYQALTGSHRVFAARTAGIDAQVRVVEYDDAISNLLSAQRDDERAEMAKRLYEDGKIDRDVAKLLEYEEDSNSGASAEYAKLAKKKAELWRAEQEAKEAAEEQERRAAEVAAKESERKKAEEREQSSDMKRYKQYYASLAQKYGEEHMYALMEDAEYDELDRLERKAYTGR